MFFSRLFLVVCIFTLSLFARADVISIEGVKPLTHESLSQYRGGFQVTDDYIINIGLSITTTINGENLLNTTIANLVIENGNLTNINAINDANNPEHAQFDQGIVNIVQFGEGNIVDDNTLNSPNMAPTQRPNVVSSELINSSIINIIQNTTDNSVIGLNTLVDIDAQVSGVIQQIRANQQLEDALLNHLQ
ncbi:hypothetical protein [Vibrio sp. PNB22_8_1]|uniref:hypothetical protein n=1 Tax=unclassified Vibrio TaxID=2614977 RepID=UPI00406A31F3